VYLSTTVLSSFYSTVEEIQRVTDWVLNYPTVGILPTAVVAV